MTEPLAAEATGEAAPAPQVPAITEDRIKELLQSEAQKYEERIKGIQSSLGKQLTSLRNENESLKRRLPADVDDDRASDLDAERRRLERERDIWKAAAENPQYAEVLTALNEADGPEDWVSVLTAFSARGSSAPASPAATEPVSEPEPTPDINPNRNRREPSGWGDEGPTADQALDFLKGFKSWPKGH